MSNKAAIKNSLSQLLKPVLAGTIAASMDILTSRQQMPWKKTAFLASIVATGNILELI